MQTKLHLTVTTSQKFMLYMNNSTANQLSSVMFAGDLISLYAACNGVSITNKIFTLN